MLVQNKFFLSVCGLIIWLCANSVLAEGLKIWNIYESGETQRVEIKVPKDIHSWLCMSSSSQLELIELAFDKSHSAKNSPNGYVCLELGYNPMTGSGRFNVHPLKNVPECEIQFYQFQTVIWEGKARASKACQYTGYCVDGKDYTYKNRHLSEEGTLEYDAFAKVCLPYQPD